MKIKSPVVDSNNCLNKISSFDSLNIELSLGFHLVNTFSNCFSFHLVNQKDADAKIAHCNKLNHIYKDSLIDQNMVFMIFDTSVINNVATLVSHICRGQDIIIKTMYHVMRS